MVRSAGMPGALSVSRASAGWKIPPRSARLRMARIFSCVPGLAVVGSAGSAVKFSVFGWNDPMTERLHDGQHWLPLVATFRQRGHAL